MDSSVIFPRHNPVDVLEHNKECLVQQPCDSLEKTLVDHDASSLIDGNQSSAVAQMHPAYPIYSSEKELVKKGNFVSGEVEDLARVEEELWEEEVPIGEWSTVGGKKNNKRKLKNKKKDGEKTELVPPKPSKKGPKPKGIRIY